MATPNRTNIIREPGLIQFNGSYFFSKDAITVTQTDEYFDVSSNMHGKLEDRSSDRSFEIKFTPLGEFEALAILYPFFSLDIGDDIYGSADLPLTIWTRSGRKYVFVNAQVTSSPETSVKVGETLFKEVTFTALIGKGKKPEDADAYYTLSTGQVYPGDAALSKAAILTKHPTMSWGDSAPWDEFATVDGVQVKQTAKLEPVKMNGFGTVGMRLADLQVTAQFQPAGAFSMSDILTATGANTALGSSSTTNDLVISYSGLYIALTAATIRQAVFKFGTAEADNLIQGLEARATRTFAAGAPVPLAYVGTAEPA